MKLLILNLVIIGGGFFAIATAPNLKRATDPTAKIKLVQHRYACPFICVRFTRSGFHGVIYEGHENFELFITGNKFEDDFEKRVMTKANMNCRGGNAAKLVHFDSMDYVMADGLGNSKTLKKITTIKTFSPASHCVEDSAKANAKK